MKVLTDRLTESPTELCFSATPAWWQERCGAASELAEGLQGALEIRVLAHRMGEDLYLEGETTGVLQLTCGRCLTRYREPVRERFRLVLEPAGHRVGQRTSGVSRDDFRCLGIGHGQHCPWFVPCFLTDSQR